jgi:hypothetical protein
VLGGGYIVLNLIGVYLVTSVDEVPVEVVVTVHDADTSRPLSNAVASWQESGTRALDCARMVHLLGDGTQTSSSNAGVLSPTKGGLWRWSLVCQNLDVPEEGLPGNVIGMTTENGRLQFRAHYRRQTTWIWPRLGPVNTNDRSLQIDAVGYQAKSVRVRREDWRVVDGMYTVNILVRLTRRAA